MINGILHQWWVLPVISIVSLVLCLGLIPLCRAVGLVDHPGQRKVHETITPLAGGPALFAVIGSLLALHSPGHRFEQALFAGVALMFMVGVVDDRRHVSPVVRFLVQVAACLVMVAAGGVQLDDFGQLLIESDLKLGSLGVPITVFAALGVINAFNMVDGMDGLAGGIFLVAAAGLAMYAGFAGAADMHWLLLSCMAAVLGFMLLNMRLPWNARARVFLGDSGSTVLGFILAWCFISLGSDHNETGERAYMPMTAVWLIAVPLLDTATLIWRRWRSGESALVADQHHLHHAFLRAGFSVGTTWFAIMMLAVLLAVAGFAFEMSTLPDYTSFWAFLAVALIYYYYMHRSWNIQRFLGRDFIYNDFDEEQQ